MFLSASSGGCANKFIWMCAACMTHKVGDIIRMRRQTSHTHERRLFFKHKNTYILANSHLQNDYSKWQGRRHLDRGMQSDGCVWKWLVPLKPMVLLIIIPFLNGYFIGNIPNIFRQTQISHGHPFGCRPLTPSDDIGTRWWPSCDGWRRPWAYLAARAGRTWLCLKMLGIFRHI